MSEEPSELVMDWLRSAWIGSKMKEKIVILDPPKVIPLSERDKYFMRVGIAIGGHAATSPELAEISEERLNFLYKQHLAILESKGITL